MWDSMDDQDKQKSLTVIQETENWVVSFHKDEKKNVETSGLKDGDGGGT